MELPHTVGESRSYIFAVIGAKEAGKSHYLAVLIHQIQNVLGPGLNMLLEPLNEYTIKRYREGFYDPVYNQHKTIDVTRSGIADRTVQIPMIYSLTFIGKGFTGKPKIVAAHDANCPPSAMFTEPGSCASQNKSFGRTSRAITPCSINDFNSPAPTDFNSGSLASDTAPERLISASCEK